MTYDCSKLAGRIVEVYTTQARFAEAMRLSERTTSLKLNSRICWKQDEMLEASKLLNFPLSEIPDYFFKKKVQD